MANVLLTTRCNLRCAYCFAQERLQVNRNQIMSLSDVGKVIAFLKRSDHPVFRAMGGEPTLHPQFPRILEMALAEDMRVDVLSNATWPESYNALFHRVSPSRLFFLLNIDHPGNYAPKLWERIERNTAAVAPRGNVTLSFNIFETRPRYEYLLELIRKYHLDKIRMSFSLPVVGMRNACLTLEECKKMGPFVVDLVREAEELGVEVRLDNAVPLCIFSYEQAGELLMKGVLDFKRNMRCDPVVDIGPDLRVWCCFCLSRLWNRHLDEFQNLQEIQAYYRQAMARYQFRLYPLEECDRCRYRDQWGCQGGCLSYSILKHGELAPDNVPVPQNGDSWQPGTVLDLSQEVEIQHYDLPKESYVVCHNGSGLEMEVDASFRPLLTLLDGRYSPEQVVDRFAESTRNPQLQGPLAEFTHSAMKKGANDVLLGLMHQGFIVERRGR